MAIAAGNQAKAVDALGLGLLTHLKVNRYHFPYNNDSWTVGTFSADTLRACPFVLPPRGLTITKIGIYVSAGQSGKKVRLGIYDDDGCYPDSLVSDCGEVDISSSGFKEITGLSLTPDAGLIWLALVSDASTAQARARAMGDTSKESLLGSSDGDTESVEWAYQYSYTYGTLPATFGGSATEIEILWGIGVYLT